MLTNMILKNLDNFCKTC